jgi:uncharacterized membrane protein HdeD (DUF308 family)
VLQRPSLAPIYRWLTLVTALLVLVQAVLAGRGWFIDFKYIEDYHRGLGMLFVLVVIVQLVLTFAVGIPGDLGRRLLAMNALLVVAGVIQLILGFNSDTSNEAAAWHIPLGVFIFGLSAGIASMAPAILKERTEVA